MFHPLVQDWFDATYDSATACQSRAWPAILEGRDVLVSAPTGSGKTLASFLAAIDDLTRQVVEHGTLPQAVRVLYVSPLKALSNDIEKNLRAPLAAINQRLLESGFEQQLSAAVRTGDTPPAMREKMKKAPPHILVTTPESLYILLSSESGRGMLSTVESLIVDEIHALAANKRGAHLSLSLARLDELRHAVGGVRPIRIGLSATQKPLHRVAEFLAGNGLGEKVLVVDDVLGRERDLALLLPDSPLEAVMAGEVWGEVYRLLAEQAQAHRTTLVFVNTRRQAERVARHLGELLGEEQVTSHHGSLSREHRLDAETRLKSGALKVLVATASLELGIDIGDVDLVCQIGSPRAVSVFLQRVGRSGHGIGRVPKGRLIPLSRDDLVECVALLDACRRGELDEIHLPVHPLDVLAQQIVAETANREWSIDDLYNALIRATPYALLPRVVFDDVLRMLAEGFSTRRGRRGALLHVDLVNRVVRGRKGARLTALTNGGAIPDLFDYDVVLEPEGQLVGTLNEDFAFESLAGDIFQLGNTSYRILRVERGTVRVADAKGQPPNIPFWFGEAPGRGDTLSEAVSALRQDVAEWMALGIEHAHCRVMERYAINDVAARQLIDYLGGAWQALGGMLPTRDTLIAERFLDDTGDMHLVIHSPYGSRLNRALGLAMRKRFCRRFNFELQAAALEDCVVLSLGATHSFDLDEVASYLSSSSVRQVLVQALLDAPVFPTHWRWVTNISLAVKRFRNGRKVPAQFQRTDAEDLVAVVFPDQLACVENIRGEREVPDHPLVNQAIRDCLYEVMDIEGLEALLSRLEKGSVQWVGRDLVSPSPLAEEIINARPYAFLDDAPAEERRTLAVQTRGVSASHEDMRDYTLLDKAAIDMVREEVWPSPASADELHDALVCGGFLTQAEVLQGGDSWREFLDQLVADKRVTQLRLEQDPVWGAAERLDELKRVMVGATLHPPLDPVRWGEAGREDKGIALAELLRSRLEILGPVTGVHLASSLGVSDGERSAALERLRQEGFAVAGSFDTAIDEEQWCDRRLLARIHRYTLKTLRARIEPVSLSAWLRFLFEWQHVEGASRMEGVDGVAEVVSQLEGCGVPLRYWEGEILPTRVYGYHPALLDQIALSGRVLWRRCLGRPRKAATRRADGRAIGVVPVAFYPRDGESHWIADDSSDAGDGVSASAAHIDGIIAQRGPSFYDELQTATGMLPSQLEAALSELVAAGRVTCDSFNGLRGLLVPESKRRSPGRVLQRRGRRLSSNRIEQSGRWSLTASSAAAEVLDVAARDARIGYLCDVLLHRYGVVCRAVVELEKGIPPWRELLGMLRRLEARGEVRGGRFVAAFSGEQFALPEAVEALRRHRREPAVESLVRLHAADPLNVTGIILPGERVSGNRVLLFRNGILVAVRDDDGVQLLDDPAPDLAWRIRERLLTATPGSRKPHPHLSTSRSS